MDILSQNNFIQNFFSNFLGSIGKLFNTEIEKH